MKKYLTLSLLSTLLIAGASSAAAQITVLGNGDAAECYQMTKMGNQGSSSAIRTCTKALEMPLKRKDEAATHVNRGVLLMRKGHYEKARADYERAIEMKPELDKAYINYGATLFYLGEPEALYNRSLVFHERQDYRAAYYDLKKAIALRPDWEPATKALGRYDVTRQKGGA